MPAVMRDSWIRGYKFQKTVHEPFQTGFFPNDTGSSARHQSRPDAIFVRSIPGRQAHFDPSKIPPQGRDFFLVELKFCPDTNPFITLETATAQHAHIITRLKSCSSRKCKQKYQVGVAGTIYNEYTIKPLVNGPNQIEKASDKEFAGHTVVENGRRRVQTSRSMADNPPDPHWLRFWI
eukprot:1140561-Pelagomonas_calceolata.AAC.2